MSTTALSTRLPEQEELGMSLALAIDPVKALEQAQQVGDAIAKVIDRKDDKGEPLFWQKIGTRKHAKFELWQLVAFCFGVSTRLVSVCAVVDELSGAAGFEAIVESVHGTRVIGQAAARCLNDEDNWSMRPKYEGYGANRNKVGMVAVPSYQLESMAQTRAASKVLASHFRWILILSGFAGTPAEEARPENGEGQPVAEGPQRISDKQRKQVFGAGKSHGVGFNDLPPYWKKYGFERADEITTDKFDQIIKDIEAHKPAAA